MALVAKDSDAPKSRAPWRGLVVGLVASIAFIVMLAFAAWCTNDTPKGVPHRDAGPIVDAGFVDAGFVDAGEADAGALIGPEKPPDVKPVTVQGPPVDARAVADVLVPTIEQCLQAALRFDPSIGGKAQLHVVAAHHAFTVTMKSMSPVLTSCVEKQHVASDYGSDEPVGVDVVVVLDGLKHTARVEKAELSE